MKWADTLHDVPLAWLLEPENPSVQYWTLLDLLERPATDRAVRATRAAIVAYPPLAELLAAQKRDGYWFKRDYYLPKHCGTFWVLSMVADLGLTRENEQVQRGCDFMFTFQRDHGGFCRRRRVQGQGIVWDSQPGPCTPYRTLPYTVRIWG